MKVCIASSQHEVVYRELNDLLRKHAGHLTSIELLAIAANMVGKIIAMLDQKVISPQEATETVAVNIECGNRQVLDALLHGTAGHA